MSYKRTSMDANSVQFADSADFSDTAKVGTSRPSISVAGTKVPVIKANVSLQRNFSFPEKDGCCDPVKKISAAASLNLSSPHGEPEFRKQLLLDLLQVTLQTYAETSLGFTPYDVIPNKPATKESVSELILAL